MTVAKTPLLVFSDDWGRHPSSCQHLVSRLLGHYQVIWVNTIGTRAMSWNWSMAQRGLEKMTEWLRGSGNGIGGSANPYVISPKMLPWASMRRANACLLGRQLASLVKSFDQLPIALTSVPIVADLIGHLAIARWVYYCVDDYGEWPGLDHAVLEELEKCLVQQADVLIAVSTSLQEKIKKLGRSSYVLDHGVDVEQWSENEKACGLTELLHYERPLIVFWGMIDQRMDAAFIQELAAQLRQGTIVLVGPRDSPDRRLMQLRRLVLVPPLKWNQLPSLGQLASVLIMPYADLPVTRAMQPLKLKEYMATMKPVVVRDLPATRNWADCLDTAGSAGEFASLVLKRLESGLPECQRLARGRLRDESWEAKAALLEKWMTEAC